MLACLEKTMLVKHKKIVFNLPWSIYKLFASNT